MTIRQDEHTGLQIKTIVEIDHWEMGRLFAEWDNVEQARFLHGAQVGFADLGGWGHMQVSAIVSAAVTDGTVLEVRSFVEQLHEYFKADDA